MLVLRMLRGGAVRGLLMLRIEVLLMIKSMTGYGRAVKDALTVEVRAVNHRYLDVSVRTPRSCAFLEEPLKTFAAKHAARGKLEIGVVIDNLAAETVKVSLNRPVLESYLEAARLIEEEYGVANDIRASAALRFPDVMAAARQEPETKTMTALALETAEAAFADFNAARAREGARLAEDIAVKLDGIERQTALIEARMPENVAAYRERLRLKITEILDKQAFDEARILTEAAVYADRVCADEELVRLKIHIAALRGMLNQTGAIGRKMDFLVQEFMREANTIGSKCSDTETVRYVVDLKSEIEKIREQVQNIE
ncbi:MAG: YicC family protein [Oscillospiraceae bacterium]|nr:YicC family protein [Oscillospiraceae bacterium]